MKKLLQRSLAVMLALVMAVSTPAAGMTTYAAPTVSENSTEISTVEESSTEETTSEENSSEIITEESSAEEQASEATSEATSTEESVSDEQTSEAIEETSTEETTSEEQTSEETTETETTEASTEETTIEAETEEATTEAILNPDAVDLMDEGDPDVDLSTLARVDFDCSSTSFTAGVTVSGNSMIIHHDSYDEETKNAEYYDGHTFYTDSDTAFITITADEDFYQYSDKLSITRTNPEGETEEYTLSPTSVEDNAYTYTLELSLTKTYTVDLFLTERFRSVYLDTMDAPHADILVETDSMDNITGITADSTKNKYLMDCMQTDTFTFAIKNSDNYMYSVAYNGNYFSANRNALEGYSVYTLPDGVNEATLLPLENTIVISELPVMNKLIFNYNENDIDITVSNAEKVLAYTYYNPDAGQIVYSVVPGEPITITVKAKENCSVDSIGLAIGDGEETTITLNKKSSYTFTPNGGNTYNFNVTSTAKYLLDNAIYNEDGTEIKAKKNVYTLSPGHTYGLKIQKGAYEGTIDRLEVIPVTDGASASDITTVSENAALITPSMDAAEKTYNIDVYANVGTEEEPAELKVGTYKLTIAPVITEDGLTITGANVKDGVTTITQEANTIKEYKLKLNNKQKTSSTDVLSAVSSDPDFVNAVIENGALVLIAKAKTTAELEAKGSVTISIYDTVNKIETDPIGGRHIKTVTVSLTKSTLEDMAAPTLKLVSATDTTLTVKVTASKNINMQPADGALHYVLFAEPAASVSGNDNPYGIQPVEYWIPAEESTVTLPVQVMMGKSNGYSYEGKAVDFKVSAAMINTESSYEGQNAGLYDTVANYYKSTDAAIAASEKTFSTKNPAYATKLTVKQQKKAVYISDITDDEYARVSEPVSIATVSCDKNETFSKKEGSSYSVIDITADENIAELYFYEENGTIYLDGYDFETYNSGELIGKHTIQVTAPGPLNGKNLSKTFTLEVKPGIEYIAFEMSDSIYTSKSKASTIKPTNLYVYGCDGNRVKNPKLNWSLMVFDDENELVPLEEAKDHYLYKYLTINKKNGTVTLKKNFVLNERNGNSFCVYVTPADEPNSSHYREWYVRITTQKQEVDQLMILSYDSDIYHVVAQNNSSVTAAELKNTGVCALKKGAPVQSSYTEEEFSRYFMEEDSYSVKSNKLLLLEGIGIYFATGTGKNVTLTASAIDGSGWKATLKGLNICHAEDELGFVIEKSNLPEGYIVSNDACVTDEDYLFIPSESTISYSGALMNELNIQIGYLTPEGNIDSISWNNSYSGRYDFWNYQIKSKKGCKLLSSKDMMNKLKDLFLSMGNIPEEYFPYYVSGMDGIYGITDINATSVIELNDKTNKNKFTLTFKNTDYEQHAEAPKVTISNVYTGQAERQAIKLTVDGYNAETSGYDTIKLNMTADGFKKASTAITYYALTNMFLSLRTLSSDGTAKYTMYPEDASDLKPGTYKFTASFYKGDTPVAVKPATVMVKVEKMKAVKGSYNPTTKYTINTVSDNATLPLEELVKQEIAFGGSFTGKDAEINGVSTRTMQVNSVQMVNTNGTFNNFFDYFEWNAETGAFSLKDTLSQEDIDYLMNKKKDANGKIIKSDADRKCYVNYTVTYGMNTNGLPFEKTASALVTINIE